MTNIIQTAVRNNGIRLLVLPNVKPLTNRSAKSLSALNDDRHYQSNTTSQSKFPVNGEQATQNPLYTIYDFHDQSVETTEPMPRKCVLNHDTSFRGCGFRIIKKEKYDTPIISEVFPNSPAKRSGLTVGDHILSVGSHNVQSFGSFDAITNYIRRKFESDEHVTLTTLTGVGYKVLKRRGGYLGNTVFDYQSSATDSMQPRLYKLTLYNHEYNFGFALQRQNPLYIDRVEQGSLADIYGIKRGDVILELNGQDAKYLPPNQIKEILVTSEKERKLDILVIDSDGYRYSLRHAIPLNSLLSFVEVREERAKSTDNRSQQGAVYL